MKGKLKSIEKGKGVWHGKRNGMGRKRRMRELGNKKSIKLKCFLDIDFTTKNCFRAPKLRIGYRFHHLIKIKTHLNTTLIGLVRDK